MKKLLFAILLILPSFSFTTELVKDSLIDVHRKTDNIELLNHENHVLKEQKSDIIDLLKWSIGSILIIIIALLGSSVYFNFRLSRKEIENINRGIELDIKNIRSELEKLISEKIQLFENMNKTNIEKINNEFVVLTKEINNNIKNDNSKLIDRFQNQLDEFNNNYRLQISTIEKSLSSQISTFENTVEQIKESFTEKINKNSEALIITNEKLTKNLEYTKNSITASIERNAGYMWEARGVLANSLSSYRRECEIYIELNNEKMIELSLSNIIEIIKKMKSLSEYEKKDMFRLLDILPSKFNDKKTEIKEIIDSK